MQSEYSCSSDGRCGQSRQSQRVSNGDLFHFGVLLILGAAAIGDVGVGVVVVGRQFELKLKWENLRFSNLLLCRLQRCRRRVHPSLCAPLESQASENLSRFQIWKLILICLRLLRVVSPVFHFCSCFLLFLLMRSSESFVLPTFVWPRRPLSLLSYCRRRMDDAFEICDDTIVPAPGMQQSPIFHSLWRNGTRQEIVEARITFRRTIYEPFSLHTNETSEFSFFIFSFFARSPFSAFTSHTPSRVALINELLCNCEIVIYRDFFFAVPLVSGWQQALIRSLIKWVATHRHIANLSLRKIENTNGVPTYTLQGEYEFAKESTRWQGHLITFCATNPFMNYVRQCHVNNIVVDWRQTCTAHTHQSTRRARPSSGTTTKNEMNSFVCDWLNEWGHVLLALCLAVRIGFAACTPVSRSVSD